ncbi:MAG: DUF4363 family protein [Clostridia bacterium]|nr:DUF4363 family protein [Clostridia bacterium]
MIRTIASIFVTLGLLLGVSFYEGARVKNTFERFDAVLRVLYDKTESGEVTYEDGTAAEKFWENQKKTLHIWLPHTAIQEIDYQLYEAVGYLYVGDFDSAIPKIEILLGMCENIPQSYRVSLENIL